MEKYVHKIKELQRLLENLSPDNLGDNFARAIVISNQITDSYYRQLAELPLRELRGYAARAKFGWKLFESVELPSTKLNDVQIVQLLSIERAVHELCYCCERLDEAAFVTWGGSSPTRLYLNSFYHYMSSMFLVDKSKKSHENLPMGGTVIKALNPIGLTSILLPIKAILERSLGKRTFGEAILLLRHSQLVHGDFSPENIEYLISQTEMRNPQQQRRLSELIWEFFHYLVLLDLKIIAIFTYLNLDIDTFMLRYIKELEKKLA